MTEAIRQKIIAAKIRTEPQPTQLDLFDVIITPKIRKPPQRDEDNSRKLTPELIAEARREVREMWAREGGFARQKSGV